jgi:transketolase
MSLRVQFAETVTKLMETDERLVLCLGDIGTWSFREAFKRWPKRCLNLGVAECGMTGFAAGLAMAGYFPIISTIESFLLRRAYEFIKLDFEAQQLPGLFVSVGGDSDYAKLGPTHMCPESALLQKAIPSMDVWSPPTDEAVDLAITRCVKQRSFSLVRLFEVRAPLSRFQLRTMESVDG